MKDPVVFIEFSDKELDVTGKTVGIPRKGDWVRFDYWYDDNTGIKVTGRVKSIMWEYPGGNYPARIHVAIEDYEIE